MGDGPYVSESLLNHTKLHKGQASRPLCADSHRAFVFVVFIRKQALMISRCGNFFYLLSLPPCSEQQGGGGGGEGAII